MTNPEFPEIVYKYRTWQNGYHRNMLLYNELYFASPKDFNDPFDCRIPPNFIDLSIKEKEQYINDLISNTISIDHPNHEQITSDIKKRLDDPIKFQKQVEELTFLHQDKFNGIISLSCRWNSILMWSIYSDYHKGFCVGFREEKLREYGFAGRIKQVTYDDNFPKLKPFVAKKKEDMIKPIFIQLFTKSSDWIFEQEYRLVNNYFDNEPLPFERLIYIQDDVFAEVILGINISNSDRNEITKICNFKKVPVYQAIKKPFKFEIERKRID